MRGRIGELRTMQIAFTYNNKAADNIRNKVETGGGAIYDLGCYACTVSRFIFADEPTRVIALIDRDPEFDTDRLSSAILDFSYWSSYLLCIHTNRHVTRAL